MNEIRINCDCKMFLELNELTEFQGGLKIRNDDDIRRIIESIKEHGFSFPFYVWKNENMNYVLDGHGRIAALRKLDELGYEIPPLPVVYVNCKNEKEARDLLLHINSHYGKMTKESVIEFAGEFDIDFNAFELPCGTIDFDEKIDIDFKSNDVADSADNNSEWNITVTCKDEKEMKSVYEKLTDLGLSCKRGRKNRGQKNVL